MMVVAVLTLHLLELRLRLGQGDSARPPEPTYTALPPDRILAAEGKSASPETALTKLMYTTGYTKHAYEADTGQTYEVDGNPVTQVHEAGGLNRRELAGR
ncbi:hypothetical protein N7509_000534 [Penicillium cosmopolitanum]|uniref:Uncharacterized protein n=1 Tax=Penicillium cosmopolitanum TaxID=1131564 RepID=A0A9W9WAY1_9EURO|nr:uncharacterized protein N7509_000534 [Penicillium cosmopolitanum]KAJ5413907.1 hypothetical protein N7509_000534 [Penicillium cosmopolitanum]